MAGVGQRGSRCSDECLLRLPDALMPRDPLFDCRASKQAQQALARSVWVLPRRVTVRVRRILAIRSVGRFDPL
jgi:hypothetical protein